MHIKILTYRDTGMNDQKVAQSKSKSCPIMYKYQNCLTRNVSPFVHVDQGVRLLKTQLLIQIVASTSFSEMNQIEKLEMGKWITNQ